MARLLTGKEVAAEITAKVSERAQTLASGGSIPTLAIIRIGENPGDLSYERGAMKRAEACGVAVKCFALPEDIEENQVIDCIEEINGDSTIHGILLMRPLPAHMDDSRVRNTIAPEKDMDGITDGSLAGVFLNTDRGYPPCTPAACIAILDYYEIPIGGSRITLVGRSPVVGRPLAMLLMHRNATVTICHTRTKPEDMTEACRNAEILIAAAGKAGVVCADHVAGGQTVIDVGINVNEEGKLCGDADFQAVEPVVAAVTPVPGGVGSVTTAILMEHVVAAAEKSGR